MCKHGLVVNDLKEVRFIKQQIWLRYCQSMHHPLTHWIPFLTCELKSLEKIVATASGVWKILKLTGAGPGG